LNGFCRFRKDSRQPGSNRQLINANLNGVGKMQGHQIPNPFGAVTDHDLLECAAPAASPAFPIDSPAKLFRTLDGSGIRGGIGIADWVAFLIPRLLGEDASKFDFSSMGWLAFGLALPTGRLWATVPRQNSGRVLSVTPLTMLQE
jgi:hypothetical protein